MGQYLPLMFFCISCLFLVLCEFFLAEYGVKQYHLYDLCPNLKNTKK